MRFIYPQRKKPEFKLEKSAMEALLHKEMVSIGKAAKRDTFAKATSGCYTQVSVLSYSVGRYK